MASGEPRWSNGKVLGWQVLEPVFLGSSASFKHNFIIFKSCNLLCFINIIEFMDISSNCLHFNKPQYCDIAK